ERDPRSEDRVVGHQVIADAKRILHASRRDREGLDQEGADQEEENYRDRERLYPLESAFGTRLVRRGPAGVSPWPRASYLPALCHGTAQGQILVSGRGGPRHFRCRMREAQYRRGMS